MHVPVLRGHIKIPAQEKRLFDCAMLIEEFAQIGEPFQLERIFLRADFRAVWNVDVNNSNVIDRGGDQSFVRFGAILRQTAPNVGNGRKGEDRDSVVRPLSENFRRVPDFLKRVEGKFFLDAFCLLQA